MSTVPGQKTEAVQVRPTNDGDQEIGWRTRFVIEHGAELDPKKAFPSFAPGGKLMLYGKDPFGIQEVQHYAISSVIYDLYSDIPTQYVHLARLERNGE
jgi:hypothetical protein